MSSATIEQTILSLKDELANRIMQREAAAAVGETLGRFPGEDSLRTYVENDLACLIESVSASNPAIYADFVAWQRGVLTGQGIALNRLVLHLDTTFAMLRELLPGDQELRLEPYYTAAAERLQGPMEHPPTFIDAGHPHSELARVYLEAVLEGRRDRATECILEAVKDGVPVAEIYMHVFQPTQYELGRLWQLNQINVAQEHHGTAITQFIMSMLYPYIFTSEHKDRGMVATCVGGELHEIGIRMVSDFFEMSGWHTYYLGANAPADSVVDALKQRNAQLLAVSATMMWHLRPARQLIQSVRQSLGDQVRILVGGYPFNAATGLWREIGADGYAPDAPSAVAWAEHLVPAQ